MEKFGNREARSKNSSPFVRKIQFTGVGLFVMLLGYGILFFCVELLELHTSIAYAIQAIVSIELNFLLSYYITWSDRREESFWQVYKRFHTARAITIIGNQLLFNGLLMTNMPYLVANTICVTLTAICNYIVGDRFTFRSKSITTRSTIATKRATPSTHTIYPRRFSIIIPVKNNGDSIRETVEALLKQNYPQPPEIIVVGDTLDTSWTSLKNLRHSVRIIRADISSPGRDSNVKRNLGLRHASPASDILAVIDGDVVVGRDWMRIVADRLQNDVQAVAGPVSGIGSGFWTDYIDRNPTASKTPRIKTAFLLNSTTLARKKPPVTANFALTRTLYEKVGGLNEAFTNSYEDYEWFSRIVRSGYDILCDNALSSVRYHREGLRPLMNEYRRSGRGCADHIVTHFPHCPFAVKRVMQLVCIYSICVLGIGATVLAPIATILAGIAGIVCLSAYTAIVARRPAALSYPLISALLSGMFVYGLTRRLITHKQLISPTINSVQFGFSPAQAATQSSSSTAPAGDNR